MSAPTIATRAWSIAEAHIPHFSSLYTPARNGILAAITTALRETPPPTTDFDGALAAIDRADAQQGAGA